MALKHLRKKGITSSVISRQEMGLHWNRLAAKCWLANIFYRDCSCRCVADDCWSAAVYASAVSLTNNSCVLRTGFADAHSYSGFVLGP